MFAALTGVPAGRIVDRFNAHWTTIAGSSVLKTNSGC
jgi:hypothetical protein